jgi:hypothetical protein
MQKVIFLIISIMTISNIVNVARAWMARSSFANKLMEKRYIN